jgi:dTDP-4-amino-4,6-dideoxygalactose transaminase
VEAALTERTKAILPVHLHGRCADVEALRAIAARHGLALIEDAAQAHGAERAGRRTGGGGSTACFSFYPGKNLGACGEGGAVVTDDREVAEKIRLLRDWGQAEKYKHILHGFNFRMDAIQAAILRVKLEHLDAWTEARRSVARLYDGLLRDSGVGVPARLEAERQVYHVYAITHRARDSIRQALTSRGVSTGFHYPIPVHLQPAYAGLGYRLGDFPVAERFASETLSLPIYPELTRDQIEHICAGVREAVEGP